MNDNKNFWYGSYVCSLVPPIGCADVYEHLRNKLFCDSKDSLYEVHPLNPKESGFYKVLTDFIVQEYCNGGVSIARCAEILDVTINEFHTILENKQMNMSNECSTGRYTEACNELECLNNVTDNITKVIEATNNLIESAKKVDPVTFNRAQTKFDTILLFLLELYSEYCESKKHQQQLCDCLQDEMGLESTK